MKLKWLKIRNHLILLTNEMKPYQICSITIQDSINYK